ncbi:MAG: carbohydrate ABC transporter permease [Anaerolineae bacterium]|nr:carbohydrate ABC transporter permease [Candidatus Roseilinea sp.]MDW8450675.1 carbohydrate ABC transporter permease [Anaerolineae bacterium]
MQATISQPTTQSRSRRKLRLRASTVLRHVVINIFLLVVVLPIAWIMLLSVKTLPDAYSGKLLPTEPLTLSHYDYVLTRMPQLTQNLTNSLIVTIGSIVATSICAVLAGYALVHLKTPGRALVITICTATLFFPTRLLSLIPIYEIQRAAGLLNSVWGLILPYVTLNLAISILVMRGIFEQIPSELAEAARMDGCNAWQALFLVMLPLITNGLVVLIIINFVTAWGEYLFAATLTNDQSKRTLIVVLARAFGGVGQFSWPRLAAAYTLVIVPGVVIFALAQRLYFKGLTEGAIKL